MRLLGLTGGIAAGKTTVARMLEAQGGETLRVDVLAHHYLDPGTDTYRQLMETFGKDIIDSQGHIQRDVLREESFADESHLRLLNGIIHPPLVAELRGQLAARRGEPGDWLIVDAALLLEWELDAEFDVALMDVEAEAEERFRRLATRAGWTRRQTELCLAAQLPARERMARADIVVHNDQTPEALQVDITWLWLRLKQLQRTRRH